MMPCIMDEPNGRVQRADYDKVIRSSEKWRFEGRVRQGATSGRMRDIELVLLPQWKRAVCPYTFALNLFGASPSLGLALPISC